ncbi:unnamed protein product, partial [Allacma fusca]
VTQPPTTDPATSEPTVTQPPTTDPATSDAPVTEPPFDGFTRSESLSNFLDVTWTVDNRLELVTFNITAFTRGYVGFGFSDHASMVDADFVLGGVYDNNTAYFGDYYATSNGEPQKDIIQSWTFLSAAQSNLVTNLVFQRRFNTNDKQDLRIRNQWTNFIFAIGEDDILNYHSDERGSYAVNILDANLRARSTTSQPTTDDGGSDIPDSVGRITFSSTVTLEFSQVSLIQDLSVEASSRKNISYQPSLHKIIRFNHLCSIVLFNLDLWFSKSQDIGGSEDSDAPGGLESNSWQLHLLETILDPFYSFFVYFTSESDRTRLASFSKMTKIVQRYIFVIETIDEITISKSSCIDHKLENIKVIGKNYQNFSLTFFANKRENFEGQSIEYLVCPVCTTAYEDYKAKGVWDNYLAAPVYETADLFNATIEVVSVFGSPRVAREDGQWDDFTQPLIDQAAVFSSMMAPSFYKHKVVYLSMPHVFDGVLFASGLSKRINFWSISVLKEPMDNMFWIAFVISMILMCYQMIFESNRVCLGVDLVFSVVGIEFMVDIRGRKMYRYSKDRLSSGFLQNGISKYYPMFVGKF